MALRSVRRRLTRQEAQTCPWCASLPIAEPWAGRHRIGCQAAKCKVNPHATGATYDTCLRQWNTRRNGK